MMTIHLGIHHPLLPGSSAIAWDVSSPRPRSVARGHSSIPLGPCPLLNNLEHMVFVAFASGGRYGCLHTSHVALHSQRSRHLGSFFVILTPDRPIPCLGLQGHRFRGRSVPPDKDLGWAGRL